MKTRYRHTTPYYDVVVLTAPARIESLAVDPAGQGRHIGVINNFGRLGSTLFASYGSFSTVEPNAVVAGRPERVAHTDSQLRLERLPVGSHGLFADWTFTFDDRTFDVEVEWIVERRQVDVWEAGWKLDAVARKVAGYAGDRAREAVEHFPEASRPFMAWWDDDPRYAHTLVTTLASGSADRGDRMQVERAKDRPVTSGMWCTVSVDGGTELEPGKLRGGRWRVGASGVPADRGYAEALAGEASGGAAAIPDPGPVSRDSQLTAAVAFGASAGRPTAAEPVTRGPGGSWLLSDGQVMAAFVPQQEAWSVWLYVAGGDRWQVAATKAPSTRVTAVEPVDDGLVVRGVLVGRHGRAEATTVQSWRLVREGTDDSAEASGAYRIRSIDTPATGCRDLPMHGFLAYPGEMSAREIERYDVLAGPVLRPRADFVIGQRALWSPAVCVQHGATSVALVPDLLEHRKVGNHGEMPDNHYTGLALDLDVADRTADAPVLAFGWRTVEGIFGYYYRDVGEPPQRDVVVAYDLVVRSGAAERSVVGDAQRRLWDRVGSRYIEQSVQPQTQPAEAAFDEAWSHWKERYDSREIDGRTLGAIRTDRVHEPGINFMSWFNALRTSYGIYSYGRDRADAELMAKGRSTLELLLHAPREKGAFPTIARFTNDGFEWQASHVNFLQQMPWGPTSYATFDMGWAAYWVLRWYTDLCNEPRAVEFARAYGDFVLEQQLPGGAVPSWIAVGTLAVDPHLRESAQTASSEMFLAELARVTGERRYLDGALRAGRYVIEAHLDRQRWDDFEPFYSNTLKSEGAADPFSGQFVQNTLSMHFAAIGFLAIYQLTGDRAWLDAGVRAVDTYLQYQYVTPGLGLSMNCFGGFAVQNTDNEALDARQSQFGVTLLDYARETGRSDYASRGIAALRAGFATMASPSAEVVNPKYFDAHPVGRGPENYAHATFDGPADYTMFDWGQGSAAAGFAEARNRFGDVWVDGRRGVAYGIDYVQVVSCEISGDGVALELRSPSPGHQVVVKVDGLDDVDVALSVNGEAVGRFAGSELADGVSVPTRQRIRIVHNPFQTGDAVVGQEFAVTARIESADPVDQAVVRYRCDGGTWHEAPLSHDRDDFWIGTIPGDVGQGKNRLDYYFSAAAGGDVGAAPEVDPDQVPFSQRFA